MGISVDEGPDRIIDIKEVSLITGICRTQVWIEERKGNFPKRRQITKRRVGWLLSEVQQWIKSRPCAV